MTCPAFLALVVQSQRWIDQVVDIAAQLVGVHSGKVLTPANELGRSDAGGREWTQFGYWGAVLGDDDAFAALDAAQYFSPPVA